VRVLYSAIDQPVPGTKGGSIHVAAIAEGLAALGHTVTALVAPGTGVPPPSRVHWVEMAPPFGSPHLRLARSRPIRQLVDEIRPDAVIERYHNFGGEAIRAAARAGTVAVLEVNAPVIDFPGSKKALVDRALLVEPMRRWREHLCRLADLIVTPDPGILPPGVPAGRVLRLEWGADTDRFHPGAPGPPPFLRLDVPTVAVFAGAFRPWHGAIHLVNAIRALRVRGRRDIGAVLIGDGPELARVRHAAAGIETIVFTGALPHDRMPAALGAADVGVAPFDLAAHGPLSLGFYWSPLKMFEYMASGLPVIAPRAARIPSLVEDGVEGVLYPPASGAEGVADALTALTTPARRQALGAAARQRAVRNYSWAAHCAALADAIERARHARAS
jgi:glycosyltransferase involved in cell wall biosynthesis